MKKSVRRHDRRREDSAAIIREKIERLGNGSKPRVLDLFSGCGGMSLGFHAAGFEISAAVEQDPDAARSHGLNFHAGLPAHCKARDITKTSAENLVADLGLPQPANRAFDVIIGGPPCQAFARVGRSKLREIAEHPEAFQHDPRSRLYIEYIQYVDRCLPLAVVMENVPDIMNFAGHNLAEEIADVLETRGYVPSYTLLNAAFYGVPQMRERMFLIAIRQEAATAIDFPGATHWVNLPPGYEGTRAVARKLLPEPEFMAERSHYQPSPAAAATLPKAVSAKEASEDLPQLDARVLLASGKLKRGARRFDSTVTYRTDITPTDFALAMRTWPGFAAAGVNDHVIRYLPRDYPLFARMKPGDQYPEAHQQANAMFQAELEKIHRSTRKPLEKHKYQWRKLRKKIVPPYDPTKFPNKWRKMEPDFPARTLMAHLSKDSYSHIHYDSTQARTISVREAARFQSFPDGFVFSGTMNPAFRQIGNAVPPLLAKAVARSVIAQLSAAALTEPARCEVAV
jgi:DNA (cytosine-5)-methyltransferase 1